MKIPYGASDFRRIRSEGFFYADKTMFLPELEAAGLYLVFLRPRRFGKSTLVSTMGLPLVQMRSRGARSSATSRQPGAFGASSSSGSAQECSPPKPA